jgi:hypothetical protein
LLGVVGVVSGVRGVKGQALGQAVNPEVGAGLGVSLTAPSECVAKFLLYWKNEVKEMSEPRYYRFYLTQFIFYPPVSQSKVVEVCGNTDIKATVKELEAIAKILRYEYETARTYLTFLEYYINLPWDVFDESEKKFRENVQMLKNLLAIYEQEYQERKVEEVTTKSGKKLYLKVKGDKVVVFGDTYHVKDQLKKLGLKWDPVERVWYTMTDIDTVKARLMEVV